MARHETASSKPDETSVANIENPTQAQDLDEFGGGWAGSGGSSPTNWAMLRLGATDVLTAADATYVFTPDDITINAQSGSDFSIALDPHVGSTAGVIVSEGGGRFQCGIYVGSPGSATLDEGSTKQRYLVFGATVGSGDGAVNPVGGLGLDLTVPIVVGADGGWDIVQCASSTIGYSGPGEIALAGLYARGIGLVTGDSINPVANAGLMALWQI